MKIIQDFEKIRLENTVITLGKFDGNHIGHQRLFETAAALKRPDQKAVIFTFSQHPSKVLLKGKEEAADTFRTIQTAQERAQDQYPEGIDYMVEFPFNRQTMSMEAEAFVREVLVSRFGVRAIVCGTDFRFGKGRRGDTDLLKELGRLYGFEVHVIDKVMVTLPEQGAPAEISSSLIKEEIRKGHMENVTLMMGRPFYITGEVLHGKHLGHTYGFPTLNQTAPAEKILPPDGVYATKTLLEGTWYEGITNVGKRPTFDDGEERTVETNLFDFNADAYGREVTVAFYDFVRPEQKFSGIRELKAQIETDCGKVKAYFVDKLLKKS
ncbi:MAG: bifunctional riboflavin kinase/FAD synthetase [Parasporobacterium sp.]|nr:bifunctional riboflavin kinase/FAD synthetase [Parasporobacterium sp.]